MVIEDHEVAEEGKDGDGEEEGGDEGIPKQEPKTKGAARGRVSGAGRLFVPKSQHIFFRDALRRVRPLPPRRRGPRAVG